MEINLQMFCFIIQVMIIGGLAHIIEVYLNDYFLIIAIMYVIMILQCTLYEVLFLHSMVVQYIAVEGLELLLLSVQAYSIRN
jgi:hypothetical protein